MHQVKIILDFPRSFSSVTQRLDFYINNSNFQRLREFRKGTSKASVEKIDYLHRLKELENQKWSDKAIRRFIRKNPIPPHYLEDLKFVKMLAKFRWYLFQIYASDSMRNDKELMKELIREKQIFFKYASELLRSDRELIELALDIRDCENDIKKVWTKLSHSDSIHDGLVRLFRYPKRILKYCTDDELREDRDLIYKATQFKYNRELVKQAVGYRGAILSYIPRKFKNDIEIALIALNTRPDLLWEISPEIRNSLDFSLQLADSHGNRSVFESYYKSRGEEFWDVAIQKRMLSPNLLPTNIYKSKHLMKVVLTRDGSVLDLCSDEIRDDFELVQVAISRNIDNIKHASKRIRSSEEMASILINLYPSIILYLEDNIKQDPKHYKQIENTYVLQSAPYCIRNNAELMEHFGRKDVRNLQYISEELKNSGDFIWKVFSYNELLLQFASKELLNDLDFMKMIIEKSPLQFSCFSSNFRGNIEIIRIAIETALNNSASADQLHSDIIVHILAKESDKKSLIDLYRKCNNTYKNEKILYFASPVLLFDETFVIQEASTLTYGEWDYSTLFDRTVSEYEHILAAALLLLHPSLYEHSESFVYHSFPKELASSILYYVGNEHTSIVCDLFTSKAAPVSLLGVLPEYLRYYCAPILLSKKFPVLEFVPESFVTKDVICSFLPHYYYCQDKILNFVLKYSDNREFFQKVFENYYIFVGLIKYASDELKNDYDFMVRAIRRDPFALQYASTKLKCNKDLVEMAVRSKPEAFVYAADELKDDYDYVNSIIPNRSCDEVLIFNLASRNVRLNYIQNVRSKK